MAAFLRTKMEKLRAEISDRYLEFKPYIEVIELEGAPLRFFFGTPQAADWYDPLQPHTRIEFDWMSRRIRGASEKIIDAGAYHGLYALVMAKAAATDAQVVAVDPVPSNCALVEVNFLLNDLKVRIEECAISRRHGTVLLSAGSCGHIVRHGGVERPARPLAALLPDATVAKVDIEGEEFEVFPEQIDELPMVHTWNVEIHPGKGREPAKLLDAFTSRGFELLWVNRDSCVVEPYPLKRPWTTRTSVIAIR